MADLPRFAPDGLHPPFSWLDGILSKLRIAHPDVVKFEVLLVMQEMCRHAGLWREWVGPVEVTGQYIEIPIPPPSDQTQVHTVYEVRQAIPNGEYLERIDNRQRSSLRRGGRGMARRYTQTQPGVIQLDAMPGWSTNPAQREDPYSLEVYASLVPLDLCVPDWFHTEHYDTVKAGVLARLLMVKGPNYDPIAAKDHRIDYRAWKARHRINAMNGYSLTNRQWTGPYFARGSQR